MRQKLLIASLGALAFATAAQAMPTYLRKFRTTYPRAKAIISCNLCHEAGNKLNYYGQDVRKANLDFKAIEPLDSDGDGFTNGDEIARDTYPGDKQSHPSGKPGAPAEFEE